MKYLLLTWSSFVWCHVISSVPSQMLIIKTLPSLFDWCALPEWIQRFREILCMCGDGLCGHWYILRLMTTHTWCKLRHCSSVAVTSLSGVKSEPAVACLANPPFRAISTFSSPKWGPPWAMNHRVYLSSCPLTLNQYNYPVGSTLHFYKSSRGISFHMENIGKSLLSLDMYINHVLLICPLAHQGPGRHIWITKLVMILYPSFIDCNKNDGTDSTKEWIKIQRVSMEKIDLKSSSKYNTFFRPDSIWSIPRLRMGCGQRNRCTTLQCRHNECDGVSNHQPHDCLLSIY